MKCHKSITITEDSVKIAQRFALANNKWIISPPPPPLYVLKCSITSGIAFNQARSALRVSMVPLYRLCLFSRFLFTKQGSLAVTVAHVTIQRFFCRIFASLKRLRSSRIKNTRLNEPRSSTRESGNLAWLLRVKHIWISSEPWSARLVNCQLR